MLEMFSNNSVSHFHYFSDLNVVPDEKKLNILKPAEITTPKIFINFIYTPHKTYGYGYASCAF